MNGLVHLPSDQPRVSSAAPEDLAILIPNFNDWEALGRLLPALDDSLASAGRQARVLVVDDASTLPPRWPPELAGLIAIERIEMLRLRCNVGHQRAIALGLYHLYTSSQVETVVVMDGDGEDRPGDVPVLLETFDRIGGGDVVFAARTKRMESVGFRVSYRIYRLIHQVLTGIEVRVGNFSVLSRQAVHRLMAVSGLWNHYAAAVIRARLNHCLVPLPRGSRLAGVSKMNFVSLLMHGLGAMSVFSDQVSARLLTAAAGSAALAVLGMGAMLAGQAFGGLAVPEWTANTIGVLGIMLLQLMTFGVSFAFLIAHRRNSTGFVAERDAPFFISGIEPVAERHARSEDRAAGEDAARDRELEALPESEEALLRLREAVAPPVDRPQPVPPESPRPIRVLELAGPRATGPDAPGPGEDPSDAAL